MGHHSLRAYYFAKPEHASLDMSHTTRGRNGEQEEQTESTITKVS